ncbi:hypothetical protein [uncultured Tenacibaculum sp.]|uniref:hypothetical protein n=1 Tax=uncultured Tenacibaculum sp. TaxID=174713 RepID=UPI0026130815|nr:hypothetical protein [uncultured Tenacibaculum sp.]
MSVRIFDSEKGERNFIFITKHPSEIIELKFFELDSINLFANKIVLKTDKQNFEISIDFKSIKEKQKLEKYLLSNQNLWNTYKVELTII